MKILLAFILFNIHMLAAEPNTLSEQEKADGWQLLFNGKNLDNWNSFRSQNRPGPGWIIEDGCLIKKDKVHGGHIVTDRKFKDYTLIWEWKITKSGNSGIKYLIDENRPGAPGPEYQMLDDINNSDGKANPRRQTASLYDIIAPNDSKKLNPVGEWNQSKIVVDGNHVEHWLNGSKVVSYELGSPELNAAIQNSKFKNAKSFGEEYEGSIMLTDHYDKCYFRNVKILEKVSK